MSHTIDLVETSIPEESIYLARTRWGTSWLRGHGRAIPLSVLGSSTKTLVAIFTLYWNLHDNRTNMVRFSANMLTGGELGARRSVTISAFEERRARTQHMNHAGRQMKRE